jgi:ribose/xylose/arabinose/galactoside ABC-type transport system permease subunit
VKPASAAPFWERLIIGTLANGLTIINVPSYYQQLVIGIVFILAVLADRMRRRESNFSSRKGA